MSDRPPAVGRVYGVAGTVALLAAAVTIGRLTGLETPRALDVPWWLLIPAFALAERFPVHFEHRRETVSVSLSTVPLVVGLFLVAPVGLLAARVLGSGLPLVLHRRQHLFKLLLNLSMLWLDAAVGIAVFRALAGADTDALTAWPAAFAAAMASDLVATVVLAVAISVYQRRWEAGVVNSLLIGSMGAAVDTCAALLIVTLLRTEPAGLGLLTVVLTTLFLSYRVYSSLRENHQQLEQLYDFTGEMSGALLRDRVVPSLVGQTKELMHAEEAWIDFSATEGTQPRLLEDRDGMAAPLVGPDGPIGTLYVQERSGEVRSFSNEDLRLFATVANHAAIALGNSRLLERTRQQAAEARHQSRHDALTGLPNRLHFQELVGARLAEPGARAAVLLLDLDRFKDVNETLGHDNGDALLCEVGGRIRSVLRANDVVARLGGDEFAILLPDVDGPEAATSVARSVVTVLERPFTLEDVTVGVGASVGVALAPVHGDDATVLLQRADVAMYTAKVDQSSVELYDLERDDHTTQRLAMVGELRAAIAEGGLAVYFQPQIDLATNRVLGAEALVRWIHPTLGFVPPDDFIPVAEQAGLIGGLTQVVLTTALEECARWRQLPGAADLRMSVNLSARSLLQASLPDEVASALSSADLPASALCLELTETSVMLDPKRTIPTLNRLRALGITIALDDFGTGHSSMAYLKELPVGEIKIDKSFVMNMAEDRFDEAIVCSIIDLARHLLVPVVAEGIEDLAIAERIRSAGCAFGQGYGFGRPMPADQFAEWLSTSLREPAA